MVAVDLVPVSETILFEPVERSIESFPAEDSVKSAFICVLDVFVAYIAL